LPSLPAGVTASLFSGSDSNSIQRTFNFCLSLSVFGSSISIEMFICDSGVLEMLPNLTAAVENETAENAEGRQTKKSSLRATLKIHYSL